MKVREKEKHIKGEQRNNSCPELGLHADSSAHPYMMP